jgi:hypothetical protein
VTVAADLGILEEKVKNHIKLFSIVVGFGFIWLGAISLFLWQIHGQLGNVLQAQANAPAQIVASLLNSSPQTPAQTQTNLAAAASVLQTTKIGNTKPDSVNLKAISEKLVDDQNRYPELPQVWTTTGVFINYKSESLLADYNIILEHAKGKSCDDAKVEVKEDGRFKKGSAHFTTNISDCETSLERMALGLPTMSVDGKLQPMIFINAIIHYQGGAIPTRELQFHNCIFQFDVPVVPPSLGQRMLQALISAPNQDSIDLNG